MDQKRQNTALLLRISPYLHEPGDGERSQDGRGHEESLRVRPDLGADFWKFQNVSWKYRQNTKRQYFGFFNYRTFRGSFSAVSKPNFASK